MAGVAALIALWGVVAWTRPVPAWLLPALGLGLFSYFPAALIAQAPGAVFRPLSVWILGLAAGVCASLIDPAQRRRDTIAVALAVSATAVALHGVYQVLWGLDDLIARIAGGIAVADQQLVLERAADGRAFAAFPTPAALGGFLALALPVTIGTALGMTGRARWIMLGLATIQALGLLSSASATAAAGLLAALVLAAIVSRPAARRRVLAAVGVGAMLVVGVLLIRGAQVTDVDAAGSPWRLRAANFRSAGEMIADHPWTGVGLGGFGEVYPQYRRPSDNETQHVHNLPLELCADLGLQCHFLLGLLCSSAAEAGRRPPLGPRSLGWPRRARDPESGRFHDSAAVVALAGSNPAWPSGAAFEGGAPFSWAGRASGSADRGHRRCLPGRVVWSGLGGQTECQAGSGGRRHRVRGTGVGTSDPTRTLEPRRLVVPVRTRPGAGGS